MGTNPSRLKRLGAWIIIVPALSLFSFSIVASAAGFQSKPDVAKAAAQVVPTKHEDAKPTVSHDGNERRQHDEANGALVIVGSSQGDHGIASMLSHGDKQVCWISTRQLVRVSAVYRTSLSSLQVGPKTYSLVTVFGADEQTLRTTLGSTAVACRLVQADHLFFLPFDPNIS